MVRSTATFRRSALGTLAAATLTFGAACGGGDDSDDETTPDEPTPAATDEPTEAPEPSEDPVRFGESATLPDGLSITPSVPDETDDEPDFAFPEDTEGPYFVFDVEFSNDGDASVDLRTLKFLPQPDNGRGTVHIDLTEVSDDLEPGDSVTVPAVLHSLENTDDIELSVSDADETATVLFRN